MKITVRAAVKNDIERIVDFQLAMARETENISLNRDVVMKGVSAVFNDPAKGKYFVVANDRGAIASTLLTPEWSDWRNGFVYWIQSVYVQPDYRKHGVFSKMFDFLKTMVKNDEQLMGLRLYVDKTNHRARAIYQKLGMNGEHYDLFEWMK